MLAQALALHEKVLDLFRSLLSSFYSSGLSVDMSYLQNVSLSYCFYIWQLLLSTNALLVPDNGCLHGCIRWSAIWLWHWWAFINFVWCHFMSFILHVTTEKTSVCINILCIAWHMCQLSWSIRESCRYYKINLLVSFVGHHIPLLLFAGIVSGAILQLREEFHLDCIKQEMVVSSMLMGAVLASLTGGTLPYHVPAHVVCQNKFVSLTLFIHGSWLLGLETEELRIKLSWNHFHLQYTRGKYSGTLPHDHFF